MYKIDDAESQRESAVTCGCRHIFSKLADHDMHPDFSRRGLLGGYLQRIWTELVASFSEQHARDLFECKDLPTVRGAVTALVVVSIQHVPFGPLAILDWEERFFWEYYNRTVMVSMKVEHVCELTGLACNIRGARVNSGNQPFFWKLHPDSVGELCRHARVQAFLAEHGLDARQATDTLVHAVAVWPPVGYLVAKQKWSFVAMGGFQIFFPNMYCILSSGHGRQLVSCMLFNRSIVEHRMLICTILCHCESSPTMSVRGRL